MFKIYQKMNNSILDFPVKVIDNNNKNKLILIKETTNHFQMEVKL